MNASAAAEVEAEAEVSVRRGENIPNFEGLLGSRREEEQEIHRKESE